MKSRRILLVEPPYSNKYPPIGLMKIASYHKMLGDEVSFVKSDLTDLILDVTTDNCISKLEFIAPTIRWKIYKKQIQDYISKKSKSSWVVLHEVMLEDEDASELIPSVSQWLKHFSKVYHIQEPGSVPMYSRIYVATLFTFYWKITIRTIHNAKVLVPSNADVFAGGVLASLLQTELRAETGVTVLHGLLDKANVLETQPEYFNSIVIDEVPLDYSILYEIDYCYPTDNAYFTFMTKGCTRTCAFCSVPQLEPNYKPIISSVTQIDHSTQHYGPKQYLLLMDNNVLASPKFPQIIQEIKLMGFASGATYKTENPIPYLLEGIRSNWNNIGFIRKLTEQLENLSLRKSLKYEDHCLIQDVILKASSYREVADQASVFLHYCDSLVEVSNAYFVSRLKNRYVDFNQGTDARYINENNIQLLASIAIRPLRIAFDYWGMRKIYTNAIRLAADAGIVKLSNYLLFNFKDKPEELYYRMKLNIDLSEELNIEIYSFPMKFIPLFGEDSKHRKFVGKFWNKKFIRAIQSISNATRGIIPAKKSFFEKAFGSSVEEFMTLLYMPENLLIYRSLAEEMGLTDMWLKSFFALSNDDREFGKSIVELNNFSDIDISEYTFDIQRFLQFYMIPSDSFRGKDSERNATIKEYANLIKQDHFINLTLTYDYDKLPLE